MYSFTHFDVWGYGTNFFTISMFKSDHNDPAAPCTQTGGIVSPAAGVALAAVLDPTVWGVGTVLTDPPLPPQINHGPHDVAINLLRYLGPGVTVVSGPAGQPVLLAFAERRLFAVIVLTVRENLVTKIEATADPSARFGQVSPS